MNIYRIACTYVLFFFIVASVHAQSGEAKAVKKAFEGYRSAIMEGKGEEALQYLDSNSVAYYSSILDHVRKSNRIEIESLPLMDKFMVLTMRHNIEKEKLQSFDGKSLLVHAINTGMIGKGSVANSGVGDVTIDKNTAKAQFIAGGQKTPMHFTFNREGGKWRFDLRSIFPLATMAFEKMIADSGKSQEEFILELLERATGRTPDESIWSPL